MGRRLEFAAKEILESALNVLDKEPMTSAISSGLQGYDRAEATVNNAAAQIANSSVQFTTSKTAATSTDSTDLSSAAVALLQGKNTAQSNLATIHVADQMQKSLIDVLG